MGRSKISLVKWLKVGGTFVVVVPLLIVLSIAGGLKLFPAEAAPPPQIGTGTAGRNAIEFVGRINQEGLNFTGYGYLTYVRGLETSDLFTNPQDPSEANARFTFRATAMLTSRAILSDVFVINSFGPMTFYFDENPSGRDFDNPDSFASGTAIATAEMRYQDILLVQSPNRGLASGVAEVTQLTATPFTWDGNSYTMGEPNLFFRFSTIGNATRTNAENPTSFVLMAGYATTEGGSIYLPLVRRNSP